MMDVGRHPNITLLSYSEVESVSGYVGNFDVQVRRKPRYVDEDICTSCGECIDVCPIHVEDEFNQGLDTHPAIYRAFAQAIPSTFVIDKRGVAPCRDACPTDQRAQGYIALIREGRFADAFRTIKEDNPFPSVCGRVCNHVCEDYCSRGEVDEPINIMRLKHFVTEWAYEHPEEVAKAFEPKIDADAEEPEPTGKQVAVVGSGPAGLTVAQDMVQKGHDVTVFEALPVAGGMMRVGIPDYRLSPEALQRDIDAILDMGVDLQLNTRIDDVMELKDEGYDAVFLGIGAHRGVKVPIDGVDLPQSISAIDFLRDANLGHYPDLIGKQVVVLGGGDVAMDAACTALRIGTMQAGEHGGEKPGVRVAYRRTDEQMPAQEAEFRQAQEEGVEFDWLVSPVEVLPDEGGDVCDLRCTRMELGEPDESGRRRPIPIEGSEFLLDADYVIWAIGAKPDPICLSEEVACTRRDNIIVDEDTMMTSAEGVFAAGDAVTGMAFVVDAIGQAHKAARAMDAYLRDEPLPGPEPELPVAELTEEMIAEKRAAGEVMDTPRACVPEIPVDERVTSWHEVCGALTEEEAVAEAMRCLQCGVCSECNQCVHACGPEAIRHEMTEEILDLNVGGVVVATGFEMWDPHQLPQYSYGKSPNIITGMEFERISSAGGPTDGEILTAEGKEPESVAIIHCVGSRDHNAHEYCSRFCCMYSLKQAHLVRDNTDADVYEFYMDMRTFGKGYEEFYERLQEEGITFVRGRGAEVEVLNDGKLRVKGEDADLGRMVRADVDMVVLSTAIEAPHDSDRIASMFGLGRSEDGFFAEAHPKLRPVETNTEGVFLAGNAQGPKDVPDTVGHAGAAASMALALLDKGEVTISPQVAVVDEELCSACKTCITLCPYDAIGFIEEDNVARVNEALCKGCGTCVAACPAGAITAKHFTTQQIMAQIEGLFRMPEEEPVEAEVERVGS
jgi:heterodisulfide reductase subunit A